MNRIRAGGRRGGFTLIELLVVIAIIAILAGLTTAAVMKVRVSADKAKAKNDMGQLALSITAFKNTYAGADHIPAAFNMLGKASYQTSGGGFNEYQFLKKMGSRLPNPVNWNIGQNDVLLNGNQCLVLFLGGWPATGTGFQKSSTDPFSNTGTVREGAFYTFPTKQLIAGPVVASAYAGAAPAANTPVPQQFVDPWGVPYAYNSANLGNDMNVFYYSTRTDTKGNTIPAPVPLTDAQGNKATVFALIDSSGKFANPNDFQIVSAGPNKQFGPGSQANFSNPATWTPGVGDYSAGQPGGDDLAHFRDTMLGAP